MLWILAAKVLGGVGFQIICDLCRWSAMRVLRTDSGSTPIAFMNDAGQAAPSAFTDVQVDRSWSIV